MSETDFNKRFLHLLQARKKEFQTWAPVHCPAINQTVYFSMRDFSHLRFKIDNTPRNPKEAMYKLGLLPLVRPVIFSATQVEYERRLAPIGGSRKQTLKEMDYWGVTAVVGKKNVKVRVVLRKLVNSEQVHFWSVMKVGENQKIPSLDEID